MKQKLVVFDMDDVMHLFNEHVSRITDVPYKKFTSFNVYKNTDFTEEEKQRVLDAYRNPDTYRNIRFVRPVVNLINRLHLRPDVHVKVVSNCASRDIRDIKYEQLRAVLDLADRDIVLHVIDMETESFRKEMPEGVFLFVDDSPYNIEASDAVHRIMENILSRVGEMPAAFDMDAVCERIYDVAEDYGQGGMLAKLLIDPEEACNILKSGGMA